MRLKSVHFLTLFLVLYVGAEVTIGGGSNISLDIAIPMKSYTRTGWIVSIMVYERGGGASAGYIASGFFGGKS